MHCKSYSHFFSKKFQHICVSLDVNFNESLTNDVVSFEQLGPEVQSEKCCVKSEVWKTLPVVQLYERLTICSNFLHLTSNFKHRSDWVEVLRPSQSIKVMSSRSFNVTTLFLSMFSLLSISSICVHSFDRNWQLSFLIQRKRRNGRGKYFMINFYERMLPNPVGIEPATSRSPVERGLATEDILTLSILYANKNTQWKRISGYRRLLAYIRFPWVKKCEINPKLKSHK